MSHDDQIRAEPDIRPPTVESEGFLARVLAASFVPYLILAVFVGLFTASNAGKVYELSVLDETPYYDYIVKIPSQGFVPQGDPLSYEARKEYACRGVTFLGAISAESCDSLQSYDPAQVTSDTNSADIYTPVYFALTWAAAQPITWLGADLLDAARLVGGLWLFLGLALLFALQVRLKVPKAFALGATLLVITLGNTYWGTQFISTDAPTYLAAALVGLAGVRFATGSGRVWELPAASLFAILLKVQNIGAIGIAVLALLIFKVLEARRGAPEATPQHPAIRRVLAVSVLSVVVPVIGYAGWLAVRALTVAGTTMHLGQQVAPMSVSGLLTEVTRFATSVGSTGTPPGQWTGFATAVFGILGLGAVFVAAFASGPGWRGTRAVGLATLTVLALLGPLLALMTWLVGGVYVPLTVRYGMIFVVPFAVCIGLLSRQIPRLPSWIPLGIGAAAALISIAT